jgi:hypothetical protein
MKNRDYALIVEAAVERGGDVTRDEALVLADRLVAHDPACFERNREPGRSGPIGDDEKVHMVRKLMTTLLAPWRPS